MPVENEAGLGNLRVSCSMQPSGRLAFGIGKDQEVAPCQTSCEYVCSKFEPWFYVLVY